tara:strand:+ start:1606 stop:1824 length:219 start_codon:yes stop_codon:yes gene_type:complete
MITKMNEEQIAYVKANKQRLSVSQRYTPDELQTIYSIYNHITGERRTKSSCARCLQNVINVILNNYNHLYEN